LGLRHRINRLEWSGGGKTTLRCPVCHEVFEVYGADPHVDFLSYLWQKGYRGSSHEELPEDLRQVAEHPHDPSEFLNESGDPWLGTFFAGNLEHYREDSEDLSEQAADREA
jgi:hypothetical protein